MDNVNEPRLAIVRGAGITVERLEAFMPRNYSVLSVATHPDGRTIGVIGGHDSCGWTLEDFVIPRLASGSMYATEVV